VVAPADRTAARAVAEGDAALRGRQLGDFVLRECIGEGAFAAVYRCEQRMLGREAVIKVLHRRLRASEVVLQRFMREAQLASRIDHPYAAHVYAFGVEPADGLAWIAMEYVHGTSLERWLAERGPLALDQLVPLMEQVAQVVQSAHDHGIVHRDLKPSNVMIIESSGRMFPKLLDFGIAKLVDDSGHVAPAWVDAADVAQRARTAPGMGDVPALDAPDPPSTGAVSASQSLTLANTTLGSPPYMSPEQWCDPQSVGPRSDLYALAVMTYEALTGAQPFVGATIAVVAELHCAAEVPPLGDRFPVALQAFFRRALAKLPADRPPTALAFAEELRAAARPRRDPTPAVLPAVAVAAAPASDRRRRAGRGRLLAAGGAALLVAAVATYAAVGRGARPPAPAVAAAPAAVAATPAVAAPAAAAAAAVVAAAPAVAVAVAPSPPESVSLAIESQPRGAEVFRLPSETRVGATPWRAEVPREAGTQVFVVKKVGYADQRVEIDLRTGGTRTVKLARAPRRSAPASTKAAPARRRGEPVDPFRSAKAR
jgi:serine/threonine-protein kinase